MIGPTFAPSKVFFLISKEEIASNSIRKMIPLSLVLPPLDHFLSQSYISPPLSLHSPLSTPQLPFFRPELVRSLDFVSWISRFGTSVSGSCLSPPLLRSLVSRLLTLDALRSPNQGPPPPSPSFFSSLLSSPSVLSRFFLRDKTGLCRSFAEILLHTTAPYMFLFSPRFFLQKVRFP